MEDKDPTKENDLAKCENVRPKKTFSTSLINRIRKWGIWAIMGSLAVIILSNEHLYNPVVDLISPPPPRAVIASTNNDEIYYVGEVVSFLARDSVS